VNVRKTTAIVLVSAVLATIGTTEVSHTPVVAQAETPPAHLPASVIVKWARTAICETNGRWHAHDGDTYTGGLGIRTDVWREYGGGQYAPAPYLASIEDQIRVAIRIQTAAGVPNYVPDQAGCTGAW
jgi:hypothetical protein